MGRYWALLGPFWVPLGPNLEAIAGHLRVICGPFQRAGSEKVRGPNQRFPPCVCAMLASCG
eukprot:4233866-Pyramimonas_sp.AAC.1